MDYIGTGIYDQSGTGGAIGPFQQDQTENESAHSASETAMLNEALASVGASRISAIDDDGQNAEYCRDFYPSLLDAVLELNDWTFATGRAILTAQVPAPLFGFAYQYMLPPNFLKLRTYNGWPVDMTHPGYCYGNNYQLYAIENKKILTLGTPVYLMYTKRVRDPGQWSPLFYQVVVTWLGSKLARAIPKNPKLAAELLNNAMNLYLPMATATDAQQTPTVPLESNSLIWGR